MTSILPIKTIIKTKKPTIVKSFRLIDFHIYDESCSAASDGSGSDNDSTTQGSYKKPIKDEQQFIIQMFGVNEKGETCCLYVQDFEPFFFIKVGDNWTDYNMRELVQEIKSKIDKRYSESITKVELVDYHKLYGFSGGKKHKFVKLTFKNTIAMKKVQSLWYVYNNGKSVEEFGSSEYRKRIPFIFKKISLELYESNIPPLLRYFHINNISPSGWVSFRTNKVIKASVNTTTCKYEYICPLAELVPMPEKETRVPYKICSFDIEASSSHGDFPIPVKTYKRLATNLVDVFIKQSQFMDTAKSKVLLQKVIQTGFGYDHFEDVDLVYPQKTPTKEYVKKLVGILMEESMETAKKANKLEDNSYALTIDAMFEQIKANTEVGGTDNGDDDANEQHENSETPIFYGKKKSKPAKLEKTSTILDMLLSSIYDRDEKIQISNDVLTRLFPRLEGDKVTFIGSTFMRYGDSTPYLNHCVVLNSCDPVDGATIETVDTEKDLLLKWTELIQIENPDIIIGYNIFGFDYEFMFRRSQETDCEREFLLLSRKIGDLCAKAMRDNKSELEIENTKMRIASGEFDLRFFKMIGRLQIDMYAYFRRDFNLSSYKLDDVAGQFISDDVKKTIQTYHTDFGDVTELYSQNLMGLNINDFIHIELTGFTADYYKNGKKFTVLDIIRGKEVVETIKKNGEMVEVTNKYNVIVIQGHEDFDKTKSIKWGMSKDDITPQDIFRLTKGSSSDRALVAKYCIQDCNLVHHLMNKIDVITGYVEMSRICSVPISFLVFRGQGIKLTSFVAKKCRDKNTLMPDLEKTIEEDGYEGAIVLPPKCSMYMDNPVACVDYSSLYPSSMISQNYSHDSKVWSKEYDLEGNLIHITGEQDSKGIFVYDNISGIHYIDIEFDTYKYIRKTKTSRAEKTKVGKKVCRWAQLSDNQKSIMPSILEELLKARKDTRAMIKTENDPFMQNILDKRQNGYKVTANSLYGQCGSRTSTFYEQDVAAATTATGRQMIIYAKRIIEEVYGDTVYETVQNGHGPVKCKAEYVYGDSVANYTPVYIKVNGEFDICTIENLAEKYGKGTDKGTCWSRCLEDGKQEKEVCELDGVETWTETGWTPLYRVIRHTLASHKKIIRVLTHTGVVDVTDDHSLIKSSGEEVSPKDVIIGTELLHNPIYYFNTNQQPAENEFITYINNCTNFVKNDLYEISGVYGVLEESDHIIAAICWQLATIAGYTGRINNCKNKNTNTNSIRIIFINKTHPHYKNRDGETNAYNYNDIEQHACTIHNIHEIPYEGYVYDLTTENHHFAAGVGNMIVHNTDSVFFTFNLENPVTGEKIRGKTALEMTIEIAQDAAQLCTKYLKPPMELSYEKTLMPFILLSKKRYVGMLYETDPNKGKLKYMGLSLKRRDSCDYLKDVYGHILNILMDTKNDNNKNNINKSIEFLDKSLNDLIDGKIGMDKLSITKALRSDYKNPNQIAHWVLADRIGKRDPGNKPKPGDRMKFVFVVNSQAKALQGDKIETTEYILENQLQIDYTHYITNQLMKPLQQLFGLALEQIWEMQNKKAAIKTYHKDLEKLEDEFSDDFELFMKKKEKYCSKKVETLLFKKVLDRIYNEKNKIQTISSFFGKI